MLDFSLKSVQLAERTILRACGRLVLGHGAEDALWLSQLDRPSVRDVALDLSCVSDLDARGLGVLATLGRRARERGAKVSVIAASRAVKRLATMTRLDRALQGPWDERKLVPGCEPRSETIGRKPYAVA